MLVSQHHLLAIGVVMHKVWIEAALNGPWSLKRRPGIPDTNG
jgi:hypothetical protein